ncbi:MAG: hypothetical protein ACI9QC_000215 [Oceanicoccus sp.]|jgi:hypothetical protein
MNFKKTSAILIALSLTLTACGGVESTALPNDTVYSLISLNVHDWVNPEKSAATINRVIDLHEEYEIPIGIYLTGPAFQNYVEMEDPLVRRLTESKYVDLGYHLRPPNPSYSGFDYFGLNKMEEEELYDFLYDYEIHAIDLETGEATDEAGGLQFIIDTLGEVPIIAGMGSADINVKSTLSEIFTDMGVLMTIGRNGIDLGEETRSLIIRPEHYDLKLYEHVKARSKDGETMEEMFQEALDEMIIATEGPQFLGIKYHENNFYWPDTPFGPCMWEEADKNFPSEPPYDLDLCYEGYSSRSLADQAEHWELYEATLQYLDEHRTDLNPIGLEDVLEML